MESAFLHDAIHSPDTSSALLPEIFIPLMLYAMGGRVPKAMMTYIMAPQQRRSKNGEIFDIKLQNAGLHQDLVANFSDSSELIQSIENLTLLSTIQVEISSEGIEHYDCFSESAQASYNRNRAYWIRQAFELCCYVFPRKFGGEYT